MGASMKSPRCGYVLVVDSRRMAREHLCTLLDAEGHRCETTADVHHALELCQGLRFDCLILQMHLEGQSGLRFAQVFHLAWRPHAVIGLSGFPSRDFSVALKSGVLAGFLQKPVEPFAIVEFVNRCVSASVDPK